MYHLLPHKYKEFEGQDNIIVGKGEVVWSSKERGWIAPNGVVIRNRDEAIRIATYLNQLYMKNHIRLSTKRNAYR